MAYTVHKTPIQTLGVNGATSPSSTAAAQLVETYHERGVRTDHGWPNSFKLLLGEILKSKVALEPELGTDENNEDINSKVIIVVVRAGLQGVLGADPFRENAASLEQIPAILDVVALIIRRQPRVLTYEPADVGAGRKSSKPLYLWLLPRLFEICNRLPGSHYKRQLLPCLRSIIFAGSLAAGETFGGGNAISTYFHGCIAGTAPTLSYG